MTERQKSSRPPELIQLINLEEGLPTTNQALAKLERELASAKKNRRFAVKLIHGYGSSGVGGDLRIAIQKRLREMLDHGHIRACIFGEDWSISNQTTWHLTQSHPDLKRDRDLGKKNLGITIVIL